MSNFSIHLNEPLTDSEAKRVAQLTAPALGGSPEKLQLLLSRQAGSRIARASTQRQADTVANILRSAGVKVEVLENATESEASAVAKPAAIPAVKPDLFAAPSIPPLAPPKMDVDVIPTPDVEVTPAPDVEVTPKADVFAAPNSFSVSADPFAGQSDPFTAAKSDPFTAAKSDPFASADPFTTSAPDPFAAQSDPFAAPKSDPFAAPQLDPFSAPKSDPFAAPKSDPFATSASSDPFAAPRDTNRSTAMVPAASSAPTLDPFAAPGSAMVIASPNNTITDLPAQARQARDRPVPRSSIRTRMIFSLIIPYVLVAIAAIAYTAYQLPIIYRDELGRRALLASRSEAKSNLDLVEQLPSPVAAKELQSRADAALKQIPETTAIIFAVKSMVGRVPNGDVTAFASTLNMTSAEAANLDAQFDAFEATPDQFGTINFRGDAYVGAVGLIEPEELSSDGKKVEDIGDVHVMFSLKEIPGRVFQSITPLIVALGLVFILAAFLANALAANLTRPITRATEQANRIALGDLDRSVTVESNDEIGDMLGSLERMRVSLKSMVSRLRRDRP